jgi:carnitine O-acetyltransferase
MLDGTPTSRLNDWLLRALAGKKVDLGSPTARDDLPSPKAIRFELADTTKQAIAQAIDAHQTLMGKHQLAVLNYTGFGKNLIKVRSCVSVSSLVVA